MLKKTKRKVNVMRVSLFKDYLHLAGKLVKIGPWPDQGPSPEN